ncbi:MAG: hypothetical protein CM1200mP13_03820 [Candidatus Pelagibacterales bacterium]|nr:MAG: hypothetical protein CM1200mP13_03820 [Pelagibacterales bacterium]
MTKPFMGVSASGCHTNMSLWKGGKVKVNRLGHKSLPGVDGVFSYVEGEQILSCLIQKICKCQVKLVCNQLQVS